MFQEKTLQGGMKTLGNLETYTENTTCVGKFKSTGSGYKLSSSMVFFHFEDDKMIIAKWAKNKVWEHCSFY